MSERRAPYLESLQDGQNWDMLQAGILENDLLLEVERFHQRTTNVPMTGVHNLSAPAGLTQWIDAMCFTDTLPAFPLERMELDVLQRDLGSSVDAFEENWHIGMRMLADILFRAFGRDAHRHKSYPSAGALYPVMPLLCVFSGDVVEDLTPGAFAFDPQHPALLRLSAWTDDDLSEMPSIASVAGRGLPSDLAIAYAVDLRRALTKYRFKGYRHAMIEVGLAAQAFRQALNAVGQECGQPLGERSWSGFADNAFTQKSGLDVRLAPVAMLQWFGRRAASQDR